MLKWSVVTVIILTKLSGIDLMRKLIVVSLSLVKLAIFESKPKDCFLRDRKMRFLIFLYSGVSLGLYRHPVPRIAYVSVHRAHAYSMWV